MRLLALYDCISSTFKCLFIISENNASIENHIINQGCKYEVINSQFKSNEEIQYLSENYVKPNDIVVLDGYQFDTNYQRLIKEVCSKLVVIDDVPDKHHVANVIINHSGEVQPADYSAEPYTQFCFGPQFALVRNAFYEEAKKPIINSSKFNFGNILISLGGADPTNELMNVLNEIREFNMDNYLHILIGGAYKFKKQLQKKLNKIEVGYHLHQNLNTEGIITLMKKCNIAITTPSTIAYEYLHIRGLLYLRKTADNQKNIYSFLTKQKLALPFEKEFILIKYDVQIAKMLQQQKFIFNGDSQKNFEQLFKNLTKA